MRIWQIIAATINNLKSAAQSLNGQEGKQEFTLTVDIDPRYKNITSLILEKAKGTLNQPYRAVRVGLHEGDHDKLSITVLEFFRQGQGDIDQLFLNINAAIEVVVERLATNWTKSDKQDYKNKPKAFLGLYNPEIAVYENTTIYGSQDQKILLDMGILSGLIDTDEEKIIVDTLDSWNNKYLCPDNKISLIGDENAILALINSIRPELSIAFNQKLDTDNRQYTHNQQLFFAAAKTGKFQQSAAPSPDYMQPLPEISSQPDRVGFAVHDLVALRDGNLLTNCGDGCVRVWDATSGKCLHDIKISYDNRPQDMVGELADGKLVLSGGTTLHLWDRETERYVPYLTGMSWYYTFKCMAADSDFVAAGATDYRIAIWDVHSRERLHDIEMRYIDKERVLCLAFMPDSTLMAGSTDGILRAIDPVTGRCSQKLQEDNRAVTHLAVLNKDEVISVAGGMLRTWNLKTGAVSKFPYTRLYPGDVTGLARLTDDQVMIATYNQVRVWDCKKQHHLFQTEKANNACVAVRPDGSIAIGASGDAPFRILSFKTAEPEEANRVSCRH